MTDHLDHLVDRAARGVLLANEGPALRAAYIALRNKLQKAEAAEARIAAVRVLHQPTEGIGWHENGSYDGGRQACTTCGTPDEYATWWPCETARALDDYPPANAKASGQN